MVRRSAYHPIKDIELHYSAWGDPTNQPVLCVHGLSRVGRDFDALARALEDEYYVICPDLPGRGWSEWAEKPGQYSQESLKDVLVGLCSELEFDTIRWVGTSLGGGLGIDLASNELSDRISHLVVNDVSPDPASHASQEALENIVTYLSSPPECETLSELESYFREIYEGKFSEMTDDEWKRFTITSARRTDTGTLTRAYDPQILMGLESNEDNDAWKDWESIDASVMVIHGVESDILPGEIFEEMPDRQDSPASLEVNCGHAPMLNRPAQIEPIREFLEAEAGE